MLALGFRRALFAKLPLPGVRGVEDDEGRVAAAVVVVVEVLAANERAVCLGLCLREGGAIA